MDKKAIPKVDGMLVDGHVSDGAWVRGYLYMTYLPPNESEHKDWHHTCHEFTPEESQQLDTTGMPILFNHDGTHDLLGHVLVDQASNKGDGQRDAFVALHGKGSLSGEVISKYMDSSLKRKRYTDVSLQHVYWVDPSSPTGVKKRALEISICRDSGRRPGAVVKRYWPALVKRSYIRPKKRGRRNLSTLFSPATMSTSSASADSSPPAPEGQASMDVDASSTPTPQQQQQQPASPEQKGQQQQQQQPTEDTPSVDFSKLTDTDLAEMVVKQREAMRQQQEELARYKKLEEEREKERQKQIEEANKAEEAKLKEIANAWLETCNERLQAVDEQGNPVPAVTDDMKNRVNQLISSADPNMRKELGNVLAFASAASRADAKRQREEHEEAERAKEELKRFKTLTGLNQRYSQASGTPLSNPTDRFTNLPEAVGNNIVNEGKQTGFFIPNLLPKSSGGGGSSTPATRQPQQQRGQTAPAPSKEPATPEELIRNYSQWYAQNYRNIDRDKAVQVLNQMIGTSAACADGFSHKRNDEGEIELSMEFVDPEGFERLKNVFGRRLEGPVPAVTISNASVV